MPLSMPLKLLAILTWIYALAAVITGLALGAPWTEILGLSLFSALICAQLLIFYAMAQMALAVKTSPSLSLQSLFKSLDHRFSHCNEDKSLTTGLSTMIILYPLYFAFTAFKSYIPLLHPYSLDPQLASLDKSLHFEHYPHEMFGPLGQNLPIINGAEYIYYLWFFVVLAANGYAIFFDRNKRRRTLYLWASVLSWILVGSIGATLLSSVGPIFYGHFYEGPNPYADIAANLAAATAQGAVLWPEAVNVLLEISNNTVICDLNGISAMPSMHVGISFLIALYALVVSRKIGLIALTFTGLIFLSSLLLGFHYAVDGYVSCIAIGIIWIICRFWSAPKGPFLPRT